MTQTEQPNKKIIRFSATDTLFFRESRPMEAMGELQSLFPPSMRTLTGAIRTWIGAQEQVDWRDFKDNKNHPLRHIIGDPDAPQQDDLGGLRFNGAWLSKDKQRLYPAPLYLMKKDDELFQLCLSEEGHYCDLGKRVRLPHFSNDEAKGSKALENVWIDSETFLRLLHGDKDIEYDKQHFFPLNKLLAKESRIGIARNNKTRTVKEGMLYQTEHIRLRKGAGKNSNEAIYKDIDIEVDVTGLADQYHEECMIRLGGEGRSAHLSIDNTPHTLPSVCFTKENEENSQSYKGIILYLLTPLYIPYPDKKTDQWTPLPRFQQYELENKTTYWQGDIHHITLKLHGAVTGKIIREGGWNLAAHQPRKVRSFIPAGSVFYCESPNTSLQEAIETLHDTQIGDLQQFGYGHIAAGLWK